MSHGTPYRLGRQARGPSVWHPGNLNVDALLESYGQHVGEGVLWLGHCVYTGLANDARCRDTGRVPLKVEYLRKVVGRRLIDKVREAASEAGYVGRDSSYRAGACSQTYCILPPYDQARPIRREITDSRLRHNVEAWHEARRREKWERIRRNDSLVDAAVCLHLWQNLRRVRIDEEIHLSDATSRPWLQIAAEQIRKGELRFKVDGYGRIHTNLTNLSRSLRCRLTVEGERLADVDISESQPLFLGMEIARSWKGQQARREAEGEGARREQGGGSERARAREGDRRAHYHMMDSTMMDTSHQPWGKLDREEMPEDLRRFIEMCESRGLYEAVAKQLGKRRDEAKKAVMVVFYGKSSLRTPASTVLNRLFPSVMQWMRQVKRQDYRRLAHLAQRIESAFMFGRVVPRIMELRPDLFIGTIHDSILTTVNDGPFVQQVMRDEFARLGLSPNVKLEPCSRPHRASTDRVPSPKPLGGPP